MKHKYQYQMRLLYFLFAFLFLFGCSNSDEESTQELSDPCNFLTEDLVKSTFGVAEDFAIEKKPIYGNNPICSYEWEIKKEDLIGTELFQVSLNFSTKGKVSDEQAKKDWEYQNEILYNKYDMEEVDNVGEKATWTKLGHGQLRVLYKGYIFYVGASYRVLEEGEDGSPFPKYVVQDHETMKERAITLANAIIAKL